MRMLIELRTALIAVVIFTVLLGLAYPLAVTGISQVAFPNAADGKPVRADGKVVGSKILGRAFSIDTGRKDADGDPITRPDPKYFQPRPSATDYSATATFFANRGPNSAAARDFYRQQVRGYLALEGRYDPGLSAHDVPIDAVTASGSGVDPHITRANARIQAHRIAAVRHLDARRVAALIDDHTDGRSLGLFGDPGVNVAALNMALDRATR